MGKVILAIGKDFSGEIFRYEVDDSLKVDDLAKKFIVEIYDGDGKANDFVLFNLSQGFEYKAGETLADKGTRNGDVILLIDLRKAW